MNARREGLLQRLSTGVFTEFVGGLGKVWSGVSPTVNHWHGILPTKHGKPRGGWTRFWIGSAGAVIQQIGLAVVSVVFLPRGCRVPRDHRLAKQGLAERQGMLCDRCRG